MDAKPDESKPVAIRFNYVVVTRWVAHHSDLGHSHGRQSTRRCPLEVCGLCRFRFAVSPQFYTVMYENVTAYF